MSQTICVHHTHLSEHARFHVFQYFKLSIIVSCVCLCTLLMCVLHSVHNTVHSHTTAGISTGTVYYMHTVHLLQQ